MPAIQTFTLNNQDISADKLVATYTADVDRRLQIRVFIDQVAGNGVYSHYMTMQRLGAGSFYKMIPGESETVPAGVTSVGFVGREFMAAATCVVRVYVKGLPADTTTPDIITEVWDSQGENAKRVWDEVITGALHNVNNSAGRRLRQLSAQVIFEGTVVSATENTVILDGAASAVDGAYDPGLIAIISGTGAGQSRNIFEYVGATRTCVVDRDWKVQPNGTSAYIIYADAGREHVNEGLARGGTINTITLNANASALDGAYVGQICFIRSGLGEDQARRIQSYNGTTKVATTTTDWGVIPDTTSAYAMLPTGQLDVWRLIEETWEWDPDDPNHPAPVHPGVERSIVNTDAIWLDAPSRTLTIGGGYSAADVWAYVTRTLTEYPPSPSVITGLSEGVITIYRGDTFSTVLTLGDIGGNTQIYFTVKTESKATDAQSVLQVSKAGLLVLNGAAIVGGVGATLTVLNPTLGTVQLTLTEATTAAIPPNNFYSWDIQAHLPGGVITKAGGVFRAIADVTRRIT